MVKWWMCFLSARDRGVRERKDLHLSWFEHVLWGIRFLLLDEVW